MIKYIKESDREKLEKLFNDGACRVESWPEHWVGGGGEGLSYCYECCKKEVLRLSNLYPDDEFCVDGGWGIDGDSTPFCEDCGRLLENSLTDWGCVEEVDHFLEHGFDPQYDGDCYAMAEVISSSKWEPVTGCKDESYLGYFDDLHKLCRQILENLKFHSTYELMKRNQWHINGYFCPECNLYRTVKHQHCQFCGFELYPF